MISVEQALQEILSHFNTLDSEDEILTECLGRVLAEDIRSTIDIPPLDNSAMDGYAIQSISTKEATKNHPNILRVIGEVAAGYIIKEEVTPGNAIRIMTGAPIPKGADAVIQFEHTDEQRRKTSALPLNEIGILCEIEKGMNIRRAGEDIAKGDLVLKVGTFLRPQEIGVLASLGREVVPVTRKPIVAILSTGDELVDIKEPLPVGKIYNSNSYSLSAQIIHYGGIPKVLGIARDTREDVENKMKQAKDADLLITSAGVSVGDYDIVKEVLSRMGAVNFWTVRMKPGKPLAFGLLRFKNRDIPHIGLPGNPVSSMITFEQFARPAILKMLGRKNLEHVTIAAISQDRVINTDGRRIYARVQVKKDNGQYVAKLVGPQGSGILTSMARANGLMIVPEDTQSIEKGDRVQVQMLDWGGEI